MILPFLRGATDEVTAQSQGAANVEPRVDECAEIVELEPKGKQPAKEEAAFELAQTVAIQVVHAVESDLVSGSHPSSKIHIPDEAGFAEGETSGDG